MEILLSPPSRQGGVLLRALRFILCTGALSFGAAWVAGGAAGMRILLPFWLPVCASALLAGSAREVAYLPDTRTIRVSWRSPLLGARRKEFPLARFDSVVSYYPVSEDARSTVCLLERSGKRGLSLGAFQAKYVPGSSLPVLAEGGEARDLREKVSSLLEVRDAGHIGTRLRIRECR